MKKTKGKPGKNPKRRSAEHRSARMLQPTGGAMLRAPGQRQTDTRLSTNALSAELLILPDGRILVQNLTQPLAELLRELNPRDKAIAARATKIPKKVL